MDDDTYADVKLRLHKLAELKRGYEHELAIESNIHEEWEKGQGQLNNFHRECEEYREKIDEPDYGFKREAVEFFGIIVRVRKERDGGRMEAESNPPTLVSGGTVIPI